MSVQNFIVALIIISAVIYAVSLILRKLKSFSPSKSGCGNDCGCEGGKSKI